MQGRLNKNMNKWIDYDRLKIGVREWALERAYNILGGGSPENVIEAARKFENYISKDITPMEIKLEEKID